MKLKESKDNIPTSFLTTYIADAWEKIGILETDIKGIKDSYANTKVVADCLSDIRDAYLIAVGRLQAFLDKNNDVEVPTEEEIAEKKNESLEEELVLSVTSAEKADPVSDVKPPVVNDGLVDGEPVTFAAPAAPARKVIDTTIPAPEVAKTESEPFQYFCDFDTPEISAEEQAEILRMQDQVKNNPF
jgi:hypothetical protein